MEKFTNILEYIVNSDQVGNIKLSDTNPKLLLNSAEAVEKYIQSTQQGLTSIIELFLSRISPYYSRVKKTTPADLNLSGDFAKLEKAGWIMTAAYYTNWVKYSKGSEATYNAGTTTCDWSNTINLGGAALNELRNKLKFDVSVPTPKIDDFQKLSIDTKDRRDYLPNNMTGIKRKIETQLANAANSGYLVGITKKIQPPDAMRESSIIRHHN